MEKVNQKIGFISLIKDKTVCKKGFNQLCTEIIPKFSKETARTPEKFLDRLTNNSVQLLYGGEEEYLCGMKLDVLIIGIDHGTLTDYQAFERVNKVITLLKIANNDLKIFIYTIKVN